MKERIINNMEIKNQTKKYSLYEEIQIPEEIIANVENNILIMKKHNQETRRKINPLIEMKIDGDKLVINSKNSKKNGRKIFGTFKAHIKNMIKGLLEGFKYKLQIVNVHFPINISYDEDKNELVVKNFLGENKDRRIKLEVNVDVKIDKDIIELTSFDIEKVGQSAANIEKGTRIINRDRRIYQDGVFIIEKPGGIL